MRNESIVNLGMLCEGYEALACRFEMAPWSSFEADIAAYLDLIRNWNDFASLVSDGDLGGRLYGHVADSLALLPFLCDINGSEQIYLDIGSGGGFPAIPLRFALPDLHCALVERSSRKVSFLKKVVGGCNLSLVDVILGDFPGAVSSYSGVGIITARSVEKPKLLGPLVASFMRPGSTYLCENGELAAFVGASFNLTRFPREGELSPFNFGELTCVSRV